ncbi:MAG: hypothetical protein ACTHLP_06140, partial [Rhizobiaceae bacterium]
MLSLSDFRRSETDGGVEFTCRMRSGSESERLCFNVETDPESAARMRSAVGAFVVGMLHPAILRREELHIEHEVDSMLLYRLNNEAMPLIASFDRSLAPIVVTADAAVEAAVRPEPRGAVAGLSGGIDSLDVLESHRGPGIPARLRISSLAVFDAGAFGAPGSEDARRRLAATRRRVGSIAAQEKLSLHVVGTDIVRFYGDPFTRSVSMRHAACAHVLADIADSYLAASSAPYRLVSMLARHRRGIDETDALLMPQFSSSSFDCVCARSGVDRFAKTLNLIERSPHLANIDVCLRPMFKRSSDANCGTCTKCGQFLMIAERLGQLDRFAGAFDLDAYRRRRWRVTQRIVSMANADDRPTTNKDILAFLDEGGFDIPFSARAVGKLHASLHRLFPAIPLS